jgi:dTDP-4-amino-4,6-dideoxygalactose transaminase
MKTIFIGSTPNLEKDDLELTKELLNKGSKDKDVDLKLEKAFKEYLNTDNIYFTNTGRTAFFLILKTLGIQGGDEVITQSFSCMAASQPILWVGAKPVYADISKDSFNIDWEDIKKKITEKTKAIVVQHLFGEPLNIKRQIEELNKDRKNKIFLIEDCAHALGADLDGNKVGSYGDFAYYSFSQDKGISCVQGGAVVCNNDEFKEILKDNYNKLSPIPDEEVKYLLRYRLAWNKIKSLYSIPSIKSKFSFGKLLILIYRKLGIIKPQVDINKAMDIQTFQMSGAQKMLLLNQIQKIEKYNTHRKEIANIYNETLQSDLRYNKNSIYLRYPILIENPEEVRVILRNNHVIVGNWYNHPIYPEGVNMDEFGYKYDCPIAETKAKYVLNLPTNIAVTREGAIKIANIVNKYAKPFKF